MKYDIRASHILIKLDANALPKDSLIAYNKILNIRKRILAGEDFGKLAAEFSDDPSARDQEGNKDHPAVKGNKRRILVILLYWIWFILLRRLLITPSPAKYRCLCVLPLVIT